MEIKGYCVLKSTNTVKGYVGNIKHLLPPNALRIIDIAVDGNGFLVINSSGTALAMVEKEDIDKFFYCSVFNGVICPPDMDFAERLRFAIGRQGRKGGYSSIVATVVILTSLIRGEFTDDFLFQKQ